MSTRKIYRQPEKYINSKKKKWSKDMNWQVIEDETTKANTLSTQTQQKQKYENE